jgi:hypothetical protein
MAREVGPPPPAISPELPATWPSADAHRPDPGESGRSDLDRVQPPCGTVDRVVKLGNVHFIGVNWRYHNFVDQDFKVVGAE